jgi:hypothetical protein
VCAVNVLWYLQKKKRKRQEKKQSPFTEPVLRDREGNGTLVEFDNVRAVL